MPGINLVGGTVTACNVLENRTLWLSKAPVTLMCIEGAGIRERGVEI